MGLLRTLFAQYVGDAWRRLAIFFGAANQLRMSRLIAVKLFTNVLVLRMILCVYIMEGLMGKLGEEELQLIGVVAWMIWLR